VMVGGEDEPALAWKVLLTFATKSEQTPDWTVRDGPDEVVHARFHGR
jgi:hypothetical protein